MKDIKGYEGLYAITEDGKVWSYPKCHGASFRMIGFISFVISNKGYTIIDLWKAKKRRNFKIHRLVAQAFIPNPLNLLEVNHKNGIKTDNRVENLEWCTHSQNMRHSFSLGLHSRINNGSFKLGHSTWNKGQKSLSRKASPIS